MKPDPQAHELARLLVDTMEADKELDNAFHRLFPDPITCHRELIYYAAEDLARGGGSRKWCIRVVQQFFDACDKAAQSEPFNADPHLTSRLRRVQLIGHYLLAALKRKPSGKSLKSKPSRELLLDDLRARFPRPTKVHPTATRLIRLQMTLLPRVHRSRYEEEIGAELESLAEVRATRALQMVYAAQQLRRVWQLRAALQAPDRPRFYRMHRAACWMLTSQFRTWAPVLGLLLGGGIETVGDTGPWAAVTFIVLSGSGYALVVERLRARWGVEVKRRRRPEAE
ncbi:hypothetical protein [Herbidospora sp. NBRC 101105]|uniref:hypothetical protein n=1 Tax=Herbidospora sp. NBRC 101105 TaxID=3032195 RepID=UPI0024A2B814|nr:hypothetical protein [Herbidospora sp. NBRC 101105]GLX92933.1 hypothetical protein Hesp01_08830 [Herbidospora sp. NBRC 101105]